MDVSKTRMTDYSALWGDSSPYDFGAIDGATPNIKLKLKERKVKSLGDAVLGHYIIGLEGEVKILVREIDLTLAQKMRPWWTTGTIPMSPALVNKDLYDYAALLRLHPLDVAAGTVTQDICLLKAVPIITPFSGDGTADSVVEVNFMFYPDRTQLPTKVYGYTGSPPA